MSFIVSLKTDEGQIEVICNLPDRGWTRILVELAAIGENYSYQIGMRICSLYVRCMYVCSIYIREIDVSVHDVQCSV